MNKLPKFSIKKRWFLFSDKKFFILAGGNTDEETPVPIPNTEVKLIKADGTC